MGGSRIPKNPPRDTEMIIDPKRDADEEEWGQIGPGRHEYKPTKEQRYGVWMAAALGNPHVEIAKHLEISDTTLRKHFRKELDHGMYEANMKVGGGFYELCTQKDDLHVKEKASRFWLERRMGWTLKDQNQSEPTRLVITVEGGLPKTLPKPDADDNSRS